MPSRPSAHSTSSRDRLLRAAKRLFAAQGYEQTATSAIARSAGTSESQLMRYFGGKVGLLDALFDAAWADLNRRIGSIAASADSPRTAILDLADHVVATLARDPEQAILFLFEARRLRGSAKRIRLSAGFLEFHDQIKTVVKHGLAEGELKPRLDAGAITTAVLGALESMLRERLMMKARGSRVFGESEIRRTLDAMLSGLEQTRRTARRRSAVPRARAS